MHLSKAPNLLKTNFPRYSPSLSYRHGWLEGLSGRSTKQFHHLQALFLAPQHPKQHDRLYIFLDSSRKDPVQKLRYQGEDYLELFARTHIVPFVLGRLNLGSLQVAMEFYYLFLQWVCLSSPLQSLLNISFHSGVY